MTVRRPDRPYNADDFLVFSTARITCKLPGGREGTGTGFFFMFQGRDYHYPVLVTNKHVVQDSIEGSFILSKMDGAGKRIHNDQIEIGFRGFSDGWVAHPDSSVDLCVLPIAPWLTDLENKNVKPFIVYNDKSIIPSDKEWKDFRSIEKITMVGYPDGLWEYKYNVPIAVQGSTATPLGVDFYGREFIMNAAIYTGSSGSPVYLYEKEPKLVKERGNNYILTQKPRVRLLGIAYAVLTQSQEGRLEGGGIPITGEVVASTKIPMNLGLAIKSTRILEFEAELRARNQPSESEH